jgi:hypothetical protein
MTVGGIHMNHHQHSHADLMERFYAEQKEIFESSEQGMYAFLDDDARVCNDTFAKMLGYASAKEWADVDTEGSFPEAFVAEKSQATLVDTFQNAMENGVGSAVKISWKKKSGGSVDTTVILVPVLFEGHAIALHFVS